MEFKEITIEEMENILLGLKKNDSKLYVWNCLNDSIVKAEVVLVNYHRQKKQIMCRSIEGSSYYLSEMVTGIGKLNFFIPEKSIYFISELKMLNNELIISWPDKLFLGDRRRGKRSPNFENTFEVDFEYDKKRYRKNCFDISTGGLSFILAQSEQVKFKEENVIPFINIYIKKEKMEVSGKITSIETIDPRTNKQYFYKATRVSLRFIEPDLKTVGKIKTFIDNFSVKIN